jgi:hypothetical protein
MFDDINNKPDELIDPEDKLSETEAESDQWNTGHKADVWSTGGQPQGNNNTSPPDVWSTNDPDENLPDGKDPHDPIKRPGPLSNPQPSNPQPDPGKDEEEESYGVMDDPLDYDEVEDEFEMEETTADDSSGGLFDDLLP